MQRNTETGRDDMSDEFPSASSASFSPPAQHFASPGPPQPPQPPQPAFFTSPHLFMTPHPNFQFLQHQQQRFQLQEQRYKRNTEMYSVFSPQHTNGDSGTGAGMQLQTTSWSAAVAASPQPSFHQPQPLPQHQQHHQQHPQHPQHQHHQQHHQPHRANHAIVPQRQSQPADLEVLKKSLLIDIRGINPDDFTEPHADSRFFVIKSYCEDDVHRAIKYCVWCSSKQNNEKLNSAYEGTLPPGVSPDAIDEAGSAFTGESPCVFLLFSVNGSGHMCGVARLSSGLFANTDAGVWTQSQKWIGIFHLRWLYVKDVPNIHLRHIRLPNNEDKPVTNTRDCQEVYLAEAVKVLRVIHSYQYRTSLFDDFDHYDRLEEEKKSR